MQFEVSDLKMDTCQEHNLTSDELGSAPVIVGMASDFVACLGSLAILLLYVGEKDLRKGAQSIITFLAIADLCTATFYLIGDLDILISGPDVCDNYCKTICTTITYLSMCSILSSFLWTAILALYFLLFVLNFVKLAERLVPLYHVLAWGLPVMIGLCFLTTDTLLYAPFVSGVWCLIDSSDNLFNNGVNAVHVAIKVPEFLGYLMLLVLYLTTVSIMCKKVMVCREQLLLCVRYWYSSIIQEKRVCATFKNNVH